MNVVYMEHSTLGGSVPIRYHLLAYRKDQLALPAGMWVLFIILVLARASNRPDQMAAAFLSHVLPLLAGVMAATCVLDDPALELQLAAPRRARRILLERLVMLAAILAIGAVSYQLILVVGGVDMTAYGSLAWRQILWLAPCLWMLGLGSLVALGTAQSSGGTVAAGMIWLAQIFLKDWLMASPWARYIALFTGFYRPGDPYLLANDLCLLALAACLSCSPGGRSNSKSVTCKSRIT